MSLPPNMIALRDEAMRTSCDAWAIRSRWRLSQGSDRAGPCPVCGGKDRFAINVAKNVFLCRKCGLSGSGVIDLVMQVQKVDFVRACEIVTGRSAGEPIDPARAKQIAEQNARDEKKRAAIAAKFSEDARRAGYGIWQRATPWTQNTFLHAYLRVRGIDPERLLTQSFTGLRGIAEHDYRQKIGKEWETICTGPAMVAAVQRPDGTFGAAHQTWLDLQQPKGKLVLGEIEGKAPPTKKVLGSKKGGAIRLFTPPHPRRLIMGEGIETTLTPFAHAMEPDTAYWAGVDLGNMAGRALRDGNHKLVHDQPDMDDDRAFIPPEWCQELIYLAEGDDGDLNTAKLTRGLRRAMRARPGLVARIVPAPGKGKDMNDLVMQPLSQSNGGATE